MTVSAIPAPPPAGLLDALSKAARILAVTHKNPDGDALGSLAAFARIMRSRGKEVLLYCETDTPDHLAWLPMPAPLVHTLDGPDGLGAFAPDCLAVLDCADPHRAGDAMEAFLEGRRSSVSILCIDHHAGNPLFGHVNWVDPARPATGEMVGELARALGVPLSGALGQALYLALASDTGSFSYANTTSHTLRMAAEIVDHGLSIGAFTSIYENNWSLARMRLWGEIMHEVRLECAGRVAVSVVTRAHWEKYGLQPNSLEDYASWLRRLAGVAVVLFARSTKSGGTKISLRSGGDVDVRLIAARFGGGGHAAAAGVEMDTDPETAARTVLAELTEVLEAPGGKGRTF